ncbi:MAG: hypothetical protein JSR38_12790 [Proteobacteria bacterium]|nr:hypothetical protein [Pseudomonadota bacterium]
MKAGTTVAPSAKRGGRTARREDLGPLSSAELEHLAALLQRCVRSKQVTLCTARRDHPEVIGAMAGGVALRCAATLLDGELDARHELELVVPFETLDGLVRAAPADPRSERAK